MDKKEETVDLSNARKEEQIQTMGKIIENGEDPFDWEILSKYHIKPILKKGSFWLVTENQWPYDNARVQLLFIYKDNVPDMSQLPADAFTELLALIQEFSEQYSIVGGALGMRFGKTQYSGATVNHLHAQLISPKEGVQCTFWIGSQKK